MPNVLDNCLEVYIYIITCLKNFQTLKRFPTFFRTGATLSSEPGDSKAESGSWRDVEGLCVLELLELNVGLSRKKENILLFSIFQGCSHLRLNASIYITLKQQTTSAGVFCMFPKHNIIYIYWYSLNSLIYLYIYNIDLFWVYVLLFIYRMQLRSLHQFLPKQLE